MPGQAAVETCHISRRFGACTAVRDVTLNVPEGAVYALLGRNGSGKTTTLKMLLGLLRPGAGTISIFGHDPARERLRTARLTGALLEAHGFYGQLTGAENLDIARRLLGLKEGEIIRVLRLAGLDERVARLNVSGYSLGMRQRLGIARALLGQPRLLILDEPGNGLDPDGIADMRAFLRTLPARTGATVLVSSHQLGEVEQTATHAGVIHDGRLVLEGEIGHLREAAGASLHVDADNPERAAIIARQLGFAASLTRDCLNLHDLTGDAGPDRRAELARALVSDGLALHALSPVAASLESIYRTATAMHDGALPPAEEAA